MKEEWLLTVTSPYSGEEPSKAVYPSLEAARTAVEKDICAATGGENPLFDPADVFWPDANSARIGDEVIYKIERVEHHNGKENAMNKLKEEAKRIIAAYNPNADFEDTIHKLASIGYRMEDELLRI